MCQHSHLDSLSGALGLLHIPILELGCSQSMPLDLRFGKHSGISSSRHSWVPWPGGLSPALSAQLCAGSSAAGRFDQLGSQQGSPDPWSSLRSCRIHQPKVCVCDSEGCASLLAFPAVPSQARASFQALIRIISAAECDCLSVCLSVPLSQVSIRAVIYNQVLTPRDMG